MANSPQMPASMPIAQQRIVRGDAVLRLPGTGFGPPLPRFHWEGLVTTGRESHPWLIDTAMELIEVWVTQATGQAAIEIQIYVNGALADTITTAGATVEQIPIATITLSRLDYVQIVCSDDAAGTAEDVEVVLSVRSIPPLVPSSFTLLDTVVDATQLDEAAVMQKQGNFVYVGTDNGRVTSVDVTDPTNISIESSVEDTPLFLNFLKVRAISIDAAGDVLYTSGEIDGVDYGVGVVDISNPAAMTILGGLIETDLSQTQDSFLVVADDLLYVVSDDGELIIFDVSTPASPTHIVTFTDALLNGAAGIVVEDDFAYIGCFTSDRLVVVDISTPATPAIEGSVTHASLNGASRVVKQGNFVYVLSSVIDALTAVNVTTPASPTVAGSITDAILNGAYRMVTDGAYCYVVGFGTGTDFLSAIDIANPGAMSIVASIALTTTTGATGIAKDGSFVYLASRANNSVSAYRINYS